MAISDRGGSICSKCGGYTGSVPQNSSDWDWKGSSPCICNKKIKISRKEQYKGLTTMMGKSLKGRMYS